MTLKTRKLGWLWATHFIATVAGWYALSALAQGVVDSAAPPGFLLNALNGIIQILMFPLVTVAVSFVPLIGGFRIGSFLAFTAVAALNSAVVVAIVVTTVAATSRALRAARQGAE